MGRAMLALLADGVPAKFVRRQALRAGRAVRALSA
jgi:hypothetical protein